MKHMITTAFRFAVVIAGVCALTSPLSAQDVQNTTAPASAQSTEALLRLGDLLSDGSAAERDYARAYAYYEQAAAAGSQSAKLRLGEMRVRGQGVAPDIKGGLGILEEVAATGESQALLSLGALYARGDVLKMNPAKAITNYESAAALGNTTAMLRLGEIYLYGQFGPENPKKALPYFRQAADKGNPWGLYGLGKILAERMVPKAGSREDGIAMLRQAEAAGIADAVVGLSDAYFQMAKDKAGIRKALGVLEDAASKGNVSAALELASIYRDGKMEGKRRLVIKDLGKAAAYLEKLRDKLSPSEMAYQQFLLDAVAAKPNSVQLLGKRFDDLAGSDKPSALRDVHRAKSPVYVFLVQRELALRGFYKGKVTGRVNNGTLRALSSFCKRTGTPYYCKDGPMSSRVAELVSRLL